VLKDAVSCPLSSHLAIRMIAAALDFVLLAGVGVRAGLAAILLIARDRTAALRVQAFLLFGYLHETFS
jgi:hypothetical protein